MQSRYLSKILITTIALLCISTSYGQFFESLNKEMKKAVNTVDQAFRKKEPQVQQGRRCATTSYNTGPTPSEVCEKIEQKKNSLASAEVICSYVKTEITKLENDYYGYSDNVPAHYQSSVMYPRPAGSPTIDDFVKDRVERIKMSRSGCFIPTSPTLNTKIKTYLPGIWNFKFNKADFKITVSKSGNGLIASLDQHNYTVKPRLVGIEKLTEIGAEFIFVVATKPSHENYLVVTLYLHEMGGVYGMIYEKWTNYSTDLHALNPAGNQLAKTVFNPNKLDPSGQTKLTKAIVDNNPRLYKQGLDLGTNVNAKNKSGNAPIHLAVKANNMPMVEKLVVNKADLNQMDATNHTPLYHAITANNMLMVNKLLSNGANGNQGGSLEAAINNNNKQVVSAMTAHKVDLSPGLDIASKNNNTEMFRTIINNGYKPNGMTSFKNGINNNNQEVAKLSLANGTNPNEAMNYVVNNKRYTYIGMCLDKGADPTPAISYFVQTNDVGMCTQLVDVHKVNPNTILNYSLYEAATKTGTIKNPKIQITQLALRKGASPNEHINPIVKHGDIRLTEALLRGRANAAQVLSSAVFNNKLSIASLAGETYGARVSDPKLLLHCVTRNDLSFAELVIKYGVNANDQTSMLKAIGLKSIQMTTLLLNKGAQANRSVYLIKATKMNHLDMCKLLINSGADCTTDPTIMKTAVEVKSIPIASLFIEKGANAHDDALVSTAVKNLHFDMTKLLLDNGAKATNPALIGTSVNTKQVKITKLLIENGAKPTSPNLIQTAVTNKQLEMVTLLVESGAPTTPGIQGAVNINHTNIAVYLLDKGAEASSPKLIKTASNKGNLVIVKKLVEKGADANNGLKPAIKKKKSDVLQYLVNNGGNVKTEAYMLLAVQTYNEKIFNIVQNAGAPVTWRGAQGETLIHLLITTPAPNVIKTLAAKGVNIDEKDNNGNTALLKAVIIKNNLGPVQAMIEAGANVNAKGNDGKSVLKTSKGTKIKKLLKANGATK